MLTIIVIALAVFIGSVVLVWCLSPAYRRRLEQPKYRFQARQRAMDDTLKKEGQDRDE